MAGSSRKKICVWAWMSKTEIDREQEKNFNNFAIAQTFLEFLLLTIFIKNNLSIGLTKIFRYS